MDIGTLDDWANNRDSAMHRASTAGKAIGVGLVVAAVVVSFDLLVLATIYLALAAAVVSTRLPARRILLLAAYPAVFAVLFAVSRWDGSIVTPLAIILKAMTAALAMLMLVTTTPYPRVFAMLRHVLPAPIADGLFLTYRSLFMLLDLSSHLLTALRLRGGVARRRYAHNAANMAAGLALLLLRALSLSQRLYDSMRVRGYAGRLSMGEEWRHITGYDAYPLGLGLVLLAVAVGMRFYRGTIEPFSGYILLAALLGLLGAIIYARVPVGVPVDRR